MLSPVYIVTYLLQIYKSISEISAFLHILHKQYCKFCTKGAGGIILLFDLAPVEGVFERSPKAERRTQTCLIYRPFARSGASKRFSVLSHRDLRQTLRGRKRGTREKPTKTSAASLPFVARRPCRALGADPQASCLCPFFPPLRVVPSDSLSPLPFFFPLLVFSNAYGCT